MYVCMCVPSCVCVQSSWMKTRLIPSLALSLITCDTMGRSPHFWSSHLQGISGSQDGGKHPV